MAKPCQCRMLGEVSGLVSTVAFLERELVQGPDSHGIRRQLHYPSVDFLGSRSAAAVLIVWRRKT